MEKKSHLMTHLMTECENQKNDAYFARQVHEEMKIVLEKNKMIFLQEDDLNEETCHAELSLWTKTSGTKSLIKKEWYRITKTIFDN